MRKCPYCGGSVGDSDPKCWFCNANLIPWLSHDHSSDNRSFSIPYPQIKGKRSDPKVEQVAAMKRIWIPQTIAVVMLLWALNPDNPYGYYILLRWVCCGVFAYLTLQAVSRGKQGWAWVFGVTAIVYNPILRIHLTRDIWSVINIVTIIISVISLFSLKRRK